MTLLCEPIPQPSSVDFPLDTWAFLSRHSMDLRFTRCEGRCGRAVDLHRVEVEETRGSGETGCFLLWVSECFFLSPSLGFQGDRVGGIRT